MKENYLVGMGDAPRFDALEPWMIEPAVSGAIEGAKKAIAKLKENPEATWDNTCEPLDDAMGKLGRVWGVVNHIQSVCDEKVWREERDKLVETVSTFYSVTMQDPELYERFKRIRASDGFAALEPAQKKALDDSIRDFVLSGADLPDDKKKEFVAARTELAQTANLFEQHVLEATEAFSLNFKPEQKAELAGIPEDSLAMFASYAKQRGEEGYTVGLLAPHYQAVMTHADNEALRAKLHRAYCVRASELDDPKRDNGPLIDKIFELSAKLAHLLGYANYAELSLVEKMAESPSKVIDFVRDMARKARPFCDKELDELTRYGREKGWIETLKPYCVSYLSERIRREKYALSKEEVRSYFPAGKAIEGLFALLGELYGVRFERAERPVWHPDVVFYRLEIDGRPIGGLYLDLFARKGKRQGAWMDEYVTRKTFKDGSVRLPSAYVVANLRGSDSPEGAYLAHDELETLFHECGHAMHHLLTRVGTPDVSGINGVEWDAVEMPSQFMENFIWDYGILESMSSRKGTGERLPRALHERMVAAKNFNQGLFICRQMEFALFDMLAYSAKPGADWRALQGRVFGEISRYPHMDYERMAHCFTHIFSGGYSAGYYSYIWAQVLSADVYEEFMGDEPRASVGRRFLNEILSVGGSRPMAESFRAFKGRDPQPDALLRSLGFKSEG